MAGENYKVLIIDDDRFLLDMYSIKFKEHGLEVNTSFGGEDALKKIREGYVPDIVLLDLVMPGMDGFGFLDAVRKDNLIPKAVLIILSNQGQPSEIEKAKERRVDGYIVKASTIPSEVLAEVMKIAREKMGGANK